MKRLAVTLSLGYIALAVLANWLASRWTLGVPFTPYVAPAGWVAIGVVLVFRDWIQQLVGLAWSLTLVPVAGGLSYGIAEAAGWTSLQKVAVASVVAFLVSETVEAVVFTPIRKRNLTAGVALSGTVGNAIDSALFLWVAFGSEAYFAGNFVGKLEMIAVGTLLTFARRAAFPVAAGPSGAEKTP